MPLSYAVFEAEQLVRVSATGIVGSDDIPTMNSSLLADRDIRRGMRLLVEAENVQPDLTFTDLNKAAGTLRTLAEKGVSHIAIVTDTTHVYALAQVFAAFALGSSVPIKVFRSSGEADEWLKSHLEGLAS